MRFNAFVNVRTAAAGPPAGGSAADAHAGAAAAAPNALNAAAGADAADDDANAAWCRRGRTGRGKLQRAGRRGCRRKRLAGRLALNMYKSLSKEDKYEAARTETTLAIAKWIKVVVVVMVVQV